MILGQPFYNMKDLMKLRESNARWSKCVPPGFDHSIDKYQDYLLCDLRSGVTVFLDLSTPSNFIDYDLKKRSSGSTD